MKEKKAEEMLECINKPVTLIHKYNQWRSDNPDNIAFILEGNDDYAFYSVMVKKSIPEVSLDRISPYMMKGKNNVLTLYLELINNFQNKTLKTLFFVDKDFDTHQGIPIKDYLYITPTYSIENLLVNTKILKELLKAEYRCNDDNAKKDIEKIEGLFKKQLNNFIRSSTLNKLNFILYYTRLNGINKNKIEKNIKDLMEISIEDVKDCKSVNEIYKFAGLKEQFEDKILDSFKQNFEKLDPLKDWRGKFFYEFFIYFLSLIKEDRCQREPIYFEKKRKVDFNPTADIIKVLSGSIDVPKCLNSFFKKNRKILT